MKWYDAIGFAETVETKPGIWTEQIVEKYFYGDLKNNRRRLQSTGQVNDNIVISDVIEIIANPYAENHYHSIRYAVLRGVKWKVTDVDASQYPKLIMTLGGVYNE